MPYPPAGALPLALVASPFISPAPNFSGPAISPIDANEPVGSQGATLSYTAAMEVEHVKLTARNNRTLLKPTKPPAGEAARELAVRGVQAPQGVHRRAAAVRRRPVGDAAEAEAAPVRAGGVSSFSNL